MLGGITVGQIFIYKNMNSQYLKRKPKYFFDGRRAILSEKLTNIGGNVIDAGSEVTIKQRSSRDKISLDIVSDSGVNMNGVWCEYLELVPDRECACCHKKHKPETMTADAEGNWYCQQCDKDIQILDKAFPEAAPGGWELMDN